jgi:hypothetical protein
MKLRQSGRNSNATDSPNNGRGSYGYYLTDSNLETLEKNLIMRNEMNENHHDSENHHASECSKSRPWNANDMTSQWDVKSNDNDMKTTPVVSKRFNIQKHGLVMEEYHEEIPSRGRDDDDDDDDDREHHTHAYAAKKPWKNVVQLDEECLDA